MTRRTIPTTITTMFATAPTEDEGILVQDDNDDTRDNEPVT
eukprot:CAMPEP_0195289932 /NCGR_PEP_ID=MMETSP0707-20130614/6005_1 /TAXON_ID=33640 /ORGANISM="Asterionellopsis glacialis, Strain CCMP134" /LENGTH=40 /DNA_ID= /DNA_START= /DNA_END= /DNA_ORIENTATION=